MSKEKIAYIFLKIAVAFPLLYTSWSMYLHPKIWTGYIPKMITPYITVGIFLWIISVVQIVVASWILFNKKPFTPALITGIYLSAIVFFNTKWGAPSFDIFYRDISIAITSFALAIKSKTM